MKRQALARSLVYLALAFPASAAAGWEHGPPSDPAFFPIAVWLQHPQNASRFKQAGINLYVGLHRGPTEEQLAALKAAGMRVICSQNRVGLTHLSDPTIAGWMHGDEPDNAQSLGRGKGYGPPVLPSKVVADYDRLRAADPSRPVFLNLGQGVAWDGWYGRGTRTNHLEDYPEYLKGCDIASFDIYPAVHDHADVKGNLWLVARGVERLRGWAGEGKAVWNCIECTRISNEEVKPTPHQVRAEVWMSIIHGSKGIIYFVHQFKPTFVEAALLADPEMLAAVTRINAEVRELAPVLNSPSVKEGASAKSSREDAPIAILLKRSGGASYLFAVAMRGAPAKAAFEVKGLAAAAEAEVLGEGRKLPVAAGKFEDSFGPYDVRLYRILAPPDAPGDASTPDLQRPPAVLPADLPRLPSLLAGDWAREREALRKRWLDFLGEFPRDRGPVEAQVLAREELPGFIREHVKYRIEDGVFTDGYLLTPKDAKGKLPAAVVFHSTVKTHAKQPAGIDASRPELNIGAHLAERGYVTLSPRCYIFEEGTDAAGNVMKMQERHPRWKGMARMTYDGIRALDYLESLPLVDPARIGAIGHSLGAKETLYLAAFDERCRAAVFSEGGIGVKFSNWDAIWYLSMEIWEPDAGLEHHQLIALTAPRAFLLLGGESADGDRSWAFIESALPVYRLLGAEKSLGWLNHRKGHSYPPAARAAAMEFLDRHLKNN